jgi:hypothetical protein
MHLASLAGTVQPTVYFKVETREPMVARLFQGGRKKRIDLSSAHERVDCNQ